VISGSAKMPTSKTVKTRNKHRGTSFEDFLKKQGLHEEVHAAALKRAFSFTRKEHEWSDWGERHGR
jgi:hypothetical protein